MFLSWITIVFTSLANANVLGDFQTFAPNADGLDFITLHSSRPLNKGYFSFGGHFSAAKDHFLVYRDMNTQEKLRYKDTLGEFDFDFAYGVSKSFSLTFAAPSLIYYQPDGNQEFKAEASIGTHTYRPGFKWTMFRKSLNFAFVGSVDIPNVENSPFGGVSSKPIYNIELAKTFKGEGKQIFYGVNLGYRLRDPDVTPVDARMFPLDDQILFSVGRSAPMFEKTRWIVEVVASAPAQKAPYKDAMDASSVDILLGVKHRISKNLNLDYGGTFEPFVDTLSPSYRVFAGMVYYFNLGSNKAAPPPPPLPEPEPPAPPPPPPQIPALIVKPEYIEVIEGSSIKLVVAGGVPPYSAQLARGSGKLHKDGFMYRTALKSETAVIEIMDQTGQMKTSTIVTKPAPKPDEILSLRDLNFVFDTANLIQSSENDAIEMINTLKAKKIKRLIIEGHTDSLGSDEYNIELSEKRAQTIAALLVRELGLSPEDVQAIGFGETKPMARNHTAVGRQLNRRVDIKVYFVSN